MKKIVLMVLAAVVIFVGIIIGVNKCGNKKEDIDGNLSSGGEKAGSYERNPDVKDPLRIGVPNISLPPMIMWGEGDNLTGFEADLIAETAHRLGVAYEIIPIDPGAVREKLEGVDIDCIWGNMMDTDRQRLLYGMTDPYITIPQAIVVYEDSEIKNKNDVSNISVVMSTPAESLADEDKLGIDFKRVSASRDYAKAFEQLEDGYSDAVACDLTMAEYIQNLDGKFKILEDQVAEAQYSAAFLLSEEKMTEAVNKTLKDISGEGIISELSKKWFGKDLK